MDPELMYNLAFPARIVNGAFDDLDDDDEEFDSDIFDDDDEDFDEDEDDDLDEDEDEDD